MRHRSRKPKTKPPSPLEAGAHLQSLTGAARQIPTMLLILNVLWFIFGGGWLIALEYVVAGAVLCVTVIGIPFGLQCFKLAGLGAWPFGKDVVPAASGAIHTIANVLWLVLAGVWICLSHLALAVASAVTIIGIPFAVQHLKFAVVALWPFGQRVTP
jgi:uncharacterized membrane protein YccF (DUF307 family)